jgi:hypothetical protein
MSAAVIPFRGEQIEQPGPQQREEMRALRDARLIKKAHLEEGDWLQAAFLALLRVMDGQQRRTLEGALAVRAIAGGDPAAETALAIIRFRSGSPEHCGRVARMLARMNGGAL